MVWDRDQLRGRIRVARLEATAGAPSRRCGGTSDLVVALVAQRDRRPLELRHDRSRRGERGGHVRRLPARPGLVVVGHSHEEIRDSVIGGVHFVQPRPYAVAVAVVHVNLVRPEGGGWRVARLAGGSGVHPRGDALGAAGAAPPSGVTTRCAPGWPRRWGGARADAGRRPPARARPRSSTGCWRRAAPPGGAQLSAGPVFDLAPASRPTPSAAGDVLRLYPYENTLRAVRITGEQLRAYLERSARVLPGGPGGPGVDQRLDAGLRLRHRARRALRDRPATAGRRAGSGISRSADGRSSPPTASPWRSTATGRPARAATRCCAVRRSSTTRASGSGSCWRRRSGAAPLDPARSSPVGVAHRARGVRRRGAGDLRHRAARRSPRSAQRHRGAPDPRHRRTCTARCGTRRGAHRPRRWTVWAPTATAPPCGSTRASDAGRGRRGRAAVSVLNRMGFAAAALGERDFDWSVDTLRRPDGRVAYPWLAANVFDSATGRRPDWVGALSDDRRRRLPVAVMGYVTPETKAPPARRADPRAPLRRGRAGDARRARRGAPREARR